MAEMLHLPKSAVDGALDRFAILRVRARSLAGISETVRQLANDGVAVLIAEPSIGAVPSSPDGGRPRFPTPP